MRHPTAAAFLSLLWLGAGCAGAPEEPPMTKPGDETRDEPGENPPPPVPLDYDGPPARASMEVMESEPPQYAVTVELVAPTAGWELELGNCEKRGDETVVRLDLTEPGADELVAQVLQTKTVRVDVGRAPGTVRVWIARWQRGVEYLVPPAARLAAVVER